MALFLLKTNTMCIEIETGYEALINLSEDRYVAKKAVQVHALTMIIRK